MTASQQDIEVQSEDGSFTAYLSVPETLNGVAIVVLQEIFGVNANIRTIADSFASRGFVAVAPDLYWRQRPGVQLDPSHPEAREEAVALMKGLDPDQSVRDAQAALATVCERFSVHGTAAVGYCYGGKVAYLLAATDWIGAAISYYGVGIQAALDKAQSIQGKLLLHIAAEDHLCPPEAQRDIEAAINSLGDRGQTVIYPGAGHAFARLGGATYDAVSAKRANALTDDLLDTLAGAG